MKRKKEKAFQSVGEVLQTYMPKRAAKAGSQPGADAGKAGDRLATHLVDSIRGEIVKTARRD